MMVTKIPLSHRKFCQFWRRVSKTQYDVLELRSVPRNSERTHASFSIAFSLTISLFARSSLISFFYAFWPSSYAATQLCAISAKLRTAAQSWKGELFVMKSGRLERKLWQNDCSRMRESAWLWFFAHRTSSTFLAVASMVLDSRPFLPPLSLSTLFRVIYPYLFAKFPSDVCTTAHRKIVWQLAILLQSWAPIPESFWIWA